jgi:subtilisin family serine protease
MKKLASILVATIWLLPVAAWSFSGDALLGAKVDDALLEVVMSASDDTVFDVLVSSGSTAPDAQRLAASAGTLKQRYTGVASHLRRKAAENQKSLVADLSRPNSAGGPRLVKRFWIADMVRIQTNREGLLELASRNDVVRISPNERVELIEPVALSNDGETEVRSAEASLDAIGARTAWAQGYTGKGRLVASIDTGVEEIHPALHDRWRGIHGDTAAAWFDPYGGAAPLDLSGHGTHVMGIMVGVGATDTIGLAPGAEWISAGVIDRGSSLPTTISDILDALQWVADPDGDPSTTDDVPDAVCNSWGISQQIVNPCDAIFFEAIENVEAMGIVCVFAAGNEGPNSMTIRNPADHAGTSTNTFSVGAADATIGGYPVPSFSSRGPSACDGLSIKPEIVAPGVAIYSSFKGQTYRTMNGTSMAAPYVAGAVAILRQYNPELTPEEIKQVLLETARDIGDPGEDNESGKGLLDLPAAIAAVQPRVTPQVSVAGVLGDAAGDAIIAPGESALLTVTLDGSVADAYDLAGSLTSLNPEVSVTVGSAYFGPLPAGGSVDNSGAPFVISVPASVATGEALSFKLALSGDPLLAGWTDTLSLVCGLPGGGQVGTVANAWNALSLSNFGQLGAGPNSRLNAGGEGWHDAQDGGNILYEAALMVASSDGAFADASRGSSFDFAPAAPVTSEIAPDGRRRASSAFDDSRAAHQPGVTVDQTVTMYGEPESGSYAIVEFKVRNQTGATIPGARCGILADIDLPGAGAASERIITLAGNAGFYHEDQAGSRVAGLVRLDNSFGAAKYFVNSVGKAAMDDAAKMQALQPGIGTPDAGWGDAFAIVATAPSDLAPGESITLALAFILTETPEQFAAAANDARTRWDLYTGVQDGEDDQSLVPRLFLSQNYPNPFNPETVIAFTLAREGNVHLEVFNLLGQSVRVLADGWNPAGQRAVVWDGTGAGGQRVASGVYFYRLQNGQETLTRKMVLMR